MLKCGSANHVLNPTKSRLDFEVGACVGLQLSQAFSGRIQQKDTERGGFLTRMDRCSGMQNMDYPEFGALFP